MVGFTVEPKSHHQKTMNYQSSSAAYGSQGNSENKSCSPPPASIYTTTPQPTRRNLTTSTMAAATKAILFRATIVVALLAASATQALVTVRQPPPPSSSRGFVAVSASARAVCGVVPSAVRAHRIRRKSLRFESNPRMPSRLRSTSPDDDNDDVGTEIKADGDNDDDGTTDKSILDTINDFLDTPILDANNRSDQGPVAEALKEFVRDEPELAQVTFSVVVVAFLVVATRIATSL